MPAALRKLFGGQASGSGTDSARAIQTRVVRTAPPAFRPPHPLRAALLAPLPSAVPLALWASGAISAPAAIVSGGVLAVMAGAHVGYARFDLWRCRELGDRLLSAHPRAWVTSPIADWRAAELTSERNRRHLAKWVSGVIRDAEVRALRAWSPLNRAAARRSLFLLRRLEQRLGDLSQPVSPRGVLAVQALLSDGFASPLYRRERADRLPDALTDALAGLDVPR